MTEPKRYLDSGESSVATTLLRSAERDGPDDGSMRRALATVAAATAITAATGSAAATTSAALWLKWLGIGLLSGGVVAFGATELRHRESPRLVDTTHIEQAAPEVAPAASPPRPPKPADEPPPEPEPAKLAAPRPIPSRGEPPVAESATDSLGRELARIDAARKRLASGDAESAIHEVDRYDREFPRGRFHEEAALLRAEAYASLGDCTRVRALTRAFEHGSVLGRRWKTLRDRCP